MRTAASSEALRGPDCLDLRRPGPSAQIPDIDAVIKALSIALRSLVADDPLLTLAAVRAAQLTRCAFGLATHIELAKLQGEHPMRLCHLSAWRDSNLFGPRERAALEWVEIMALSPASVDPELTGRFVDVDLSSKDISDLSLVVASVNLCHLLRSTVTAIGSAQIRRAG